MNNLPKLLRTFPKRYLLTLGIILTILASLLTLCFSYILKLLIDSAMDKNFETFYSYLFIILILVVMDLSFVYLKSISLGKYTESGIQTLRNKFAQKLFKMDFHQLSQSHSGELTSIGTNDIAKVRGFTTVTMPDLFRVPIMGLGALIFLFILSWKLTLVSLIVIPILIIGSSILSKPIAPISNKLQSILGDVNTIGTDFIKGIEISKAYRIESVMDEKYQQAVHSTIDNGKELAKKRAILEGFSSVLSIVPFVVTFIMGGYLVVKNDMTIGDLLAFINLLNFLTFPLSRLPILVGDALSELVAFSRIISVLDQPNERTDGEHYPIDQTNPWIEFKQVSFAYPNEQEFTIKNLSLQINHSDSVAFVGPSGSGKSTIIKLIMGFYDQYEGEIFIGGHELRTWNLTSLRQTISFVSQDTYLFPESIEENILYGHSAHHEKLIKSAEAANAHEFILKLKDGYQTKVGELGNTLSGGQKQRIAIARAVIKDAPLLLLDEPTSSLDNDSEQIVQDALKQVMVNKTSIVVAHRLSTIKHVNKIIVLKDGEVIESGNHEELNQLNGLYKELYKKQLETEVTTHG